MKFYLLLLSVVVGILIHVSHGEKLETHTAHAESENLNLRGNLKSKLNSQSELETKLFTQEEAGLQAMGVPGTVLANCKAKLATMGRINGCSCPTSIMKNFYAYCIFFDKSCDNHDACYHIRGVSKSTCDSQFKSDLKNQCPKVTINYYFGKKRIFEPTCFSNAMGFYYAVSKVGSAKDAYNDDQKYSLTHNIAECVHTPSSSSGGGSSSSLTKRVQNVIRNVFRFG